MTDNADDHRRAAARRRIPPGFTPSVENGKREYGQCHGDMQPDGTHEMQFEGFLLVQNVDVRRHHRPRFAAESSGCVTILTVILAALSSLSTCATTSQMAARSARTYTAWPRYRV